MTFSVNTNVGAMVALQNLASTQSQLMTTQNRVNTGLKVASAKDNAAIWAIAQNQRATVASRAANAVPPTRAGAALQLGRVAATQHLDRFVR